jgi:hypothetical protein
MHGPASLARQPYAGAEGYGQDAGQYQTHRSGDGPGPKETGLTDKQRGEGAWRRGSGLLLAGPVTRRTRVVGRWSRPVGHGAQAQGRSRSRRKFAARARVLCPTTPVPPGRTALSGRQRGVLRDRPCDFAQPECGIAR